MNRGVILLLFYCKYVEHLVKKRHKQSPVLIRPQYDAADRLKIESILNNQAKKKGVRRLEQ